MKLHADQLSDLGGAALAARFKALSADHLEYTSDAGVAAMAKAGTVAVLLPGAFYFLREKQLPPIAQLRAAGVPIALATDSNPGSSPVTSLLLMLNMACTLFRLTPEEALAGVTRHAATALGLSASHGTLEVGKTADFCHLGHRAAGGTLPIASASIPAASSCRRACPSAWRTWGGSGRPLRHAAGITRMATSDPADFLDRCHPAVRAIYEYWDRKRGDRRMPARRDIDPTEFVPHLPGIMLVDVVADERRYVYRLVGTREVEARGRNPTGRPVGEKLPRQLARERAAQL